MGEASRRKRATENWLASLTESERIVARTSIGFHRAFPVEGACYRIAFFLAVYLLERHGIEGRAVVGYVNDGTDDICSSHGWYEHGGKKVDLALSLPLNPEVQKRGPVTILDWDYVAGWPKYTYMAAPTAAGAAQMEYLRTHPATRRQMLDNDELHSAMAERAGSTILMREFLDAAPDKMGFEHLSRRLESALSTII